MKKMTVGKEKSIDISFNINGNDMTVSVKPSESLIDMIRRLGYKGTKKGCDTGDCGSCALILDGKAVIGCLMPAFYADGKKITTIEGIGSILNPHPIQKAFVDAGAVQCGFCIPGMIISTKFLLDRFPTPDEKTIKHHLDGNLCRCTGYVKQIEAVRIASNRLKNTNRE